MADGHIDEDYREVKSWSIHKLVAQYLINSYLYYICDLTVVSDSVFDYTCRELLDRWDDVGQHEHGHLIDKGCLQAGSGFTLRESDFPNIVKGAATDVAREAGLIKWDKKLKQWIPKA